MGILHALWPLIVIAALIFAAGIVFHIFEGKRSSEGGQPPPFEKKAYFFSRAERSFFEVLRQAVGEQYHIFAKVRMEDLLILPRGTEKRQGWLNRVRSKHVDFVLCDRKDIAPTLVIELDDKSHDRDAARDRDATKDSILKAAHLPLLRVKAQRTYSTRELLQMIAAATGSQSDANHKR